MEIRSKEAVIGSGQMRDGGSHPRRIRAPFLLIEEAESLNPIREVFFPAEIHFLSDFRVAD
jgi:hypothetical protein